MDSVKLIKLKFLSRIVQKSLLKVFYTWKTLSCSSRVFPFKTPEKVYFNPSPDPNSATRSNVNYVKQSPTKLTLNKTKENFEERKSFKEFGQKDSIFEQIKSSLITKARVKPRINSIDLNWKSSLLGTQGLETQGLRTRHKRANTGCADPSNFQ
jgi:hypothetical protein